MVKHINGSHQKENKRFLEKVHETITEHHLFEEQDAVLVGFSGGPDSTALLWSLHRLAPELGLRLGAAHLNHNLRREAAQDADVAESFAERLKIPCHIKTVNVAAYQKTHRLCVEEAARNMRYQFLYETAVFHGYTKIALGHHADDNAELILMNLLRGSGLAGLSGIPVKRSLKAPSSTSTDSPVIVRPLILLNKSDIYTFLKLNHLSWCTDASNHDTIHLRNKIRHELLPILKKRFNPNIVETLNRSAFLAQGEEAWISTSLQPVFDDIIVREGRQRVSLTISRLMAHPRPVAGRILRQAIYQVKGDLRKITLQHVTSVLCLCSRRQHRGRLDLPSRIRAERNATHLTVFRSNTPLRQCASLSMPPLAPMPVYQLEKPGTTRLDAYKLIISADLLPKKVKADFRSAGHHRAFFDMDTITFPLTIRTLRTGDQFKPLGAGGTQKLKKFFIDHHVPASERRRCPLLVSAGNIIWVVGHRIDTRFKITDSTQKTLKIEFTLAEPVEDD